MARAERNSRQNGGVSIEWPSQAEFRRAVGEFRETEFGEFVASVFAARGWETALNDGILEASQSDEQFRAGIVSGPQSLVTIITESGVDTLVIRDRVWGTVAAFILSTRRGENPTRVFSAQELYELLTYGVDSEARATIYRNFLDPYYSPSQASDSTRLPRIIDNRSHLSISVMAVVLFGLLVVGLALAGLPVTPDPAADRPASEPIATPVPQPGTPVATTSTRLAIPASCPSPPVASHPATLRPAVRTGATSGGLDGWEELLTQNTSHWEFDPNDQRAGVVPEERHSAVYRGPGGVHYRFIADRWQTEDKARQMQDYHTEGIGIRWGRYVLRVDSTDTAAFSTPDARELLTAVPSPNGPQLGEQCVAALIRQAAE